MRERCAYSLIEFGAVERCPPTLWYMLAYKEPLRVPAWSGYGCRGSRKGLRGVAVDRRRIRSLKVRTHRATGQHHYSQRRRDGSCASPEFGWKIVRHFRLGFRSEGIVTSEWIVFLREMNDIMLAMDRQSRWPTSIMTTRPVQPSTMELPAVLLPCRYALRLTIKDQRRPNKCVQVALTP